MTRSALSVPAVIFLSTPSGWRATGFAAASRFSPVFLSTLSGWRATTSCCRTTFYRQIFLSTPSGWRATSKPAGQPLKSPISIHALRVEGDEAEAGGEIDKRNFYPRPPGGGRPRRTAAELHNPYFYPRPPGGGRHVGQPAVDGCKDFYPRPPGGGRLAARRNHSKYLRISIHALRVEGDCVITPTAWA